MNERRSESMSVSSPESESASGSESKSRTDRLLVCNPASGSADHTSDVRTRGEKRGFVVRETEAAGDARRFAREAAVDDDGGDTDESDGEGDETVDGGSATSPVSLIAVAGGDGTVNEVIHGLLEADALERVDIAVLPTGTANVFARTLGIPDLDAGFEVIDDGTSRRVDVGVADGRPFLNTCLAGLSADANASTPDEWKRQFGPLAYVLTTLRFLPEYEGLPLEIRYDETEVDGDAGTGGGFGSGASVELESGDNTDTGVDGNDDATNATDADDAHDDDDGTTSTWRGNALLVLVGNAFRLPTVRRRSRTPIADAALELVILERGRDGESLAVDDKGTASVFDTDLDAIPGPITRVEASSVSITTREDDQEPVNFSLDGEPLSATDLEVSIRERSLSVLVGPESPVRDQ
ncbi:diacylglycerol kinase [Natronolimnobius sp. AArcel1]|uniref:diacylglycerol/lipid kinase family protein n=1 Tax=Natronolimnobius sp. AArcel1 TaxID=1679093 RepID=UPI0013ED1E3C|nr:diacylglycerol kinase family protein [Natronolimnobius sp. AArcel1]NGM70583.1 diacylglycerol kinase [Natronolimnobius sp. AArcel1]